MKSAIINYNVDVYKSTARDFKSEHKDVILNTKGSICK